MQMSNHYVVAIVNGVFLILSDCDLYIYVKLLSLYLTYTILGSFLFNYFGFPKFYNNDICQ